MPYKVQASRPNRTVLVSVRQGGQERPVNLRGKDVVYSDVLTEDLRTQAKLRYVTCKQVDQVPEDVTNPDHGQGALMAAVDQRNAEMTGEANKTPQDTPPQDPGGEDSSGDGDTRYFTESEMLDLKKAELQKLIELHPELKIDPNQNKDNLQAALLGYDVPWIDREKLSE